MGDRLRQWVIDAGERARALVSDLSDEQLIGPYLPTVNPMRWEIGHAAWFYSRWVLRDGLGQAPVRADEDELFDSIAIAHTRRWSLPLPSFEDTLAYAAAVHERVLDAADTASERVDYLIRYAVFHEDMHGEAFTYMRQSLGYPEPPAHGRGQAPREQRRPPENSPNAGPLPGDVDIPAGRFVLGAARDGGFVFDNEKWGHEVTVAPFRIARAPVSQGEYAAFVDDGGYRRPDLWSVAGWGWRLASALDHPLYWRRVDGVWQRRHYDRWVALEPHRPVIFVSAYEAEAYCRWAGRRLPTELEWEVAASAEPDGAGNLGPRKRRFPWGDDAPTAERAHLDSRVIGCADVAAYPAGDSAFGCRQMLGNVWEWTATLLAPYPGFEADMYAEYTEPWFGSHRVLRGGAFCTRSRLIRNTWRNFYMPNRNDVLAGFRTCALDT